MPSIDTTLFSLRLHPKQGLTMRKLTNISRRFLREDDGASMAEYALLLGVITVALITVITQFRDSISNIFSRTTNTLNSA